MKRKITALLLYFILCYTAFSPVYSFGSSVINNISFTKESNNSVCIDLESSGEFQYFVYAQKDTLYIELKDTKLSEEIYNKVTSLKQVDSNVKDVNISNIKDNHYKISIELADLKKFKFVLNTKNGIVAPYGFDHKTKVKPVKVNRASNQVKNKSIIANNDSKPALKPLATNYKDINPDEDFISTSAYNSIKSSENRKSSIRLNDANVYIPPDYGKEPQKEVIKPSTNPTVSIIDKTPVKHVAKVEEPKKEEVIYKPIPSDELIKRLQSGVDEMPRLVTENKLDIKKPEVAENTVVNKDQNTLDQNQDVLESLISNIKPLPKGKAINLDSKSASAITPKGSKIYEVPGQEDSKQSNIDTMISDTSNNLQSRELNSLSLGLSEEYDDVTIDDVIDIPAPKPAYTSDGAMAFTVFSSKGIYKGSAPIRPVQTVDQGANFSGYNYSMIERGDNDNEISARFKNHISDAKNYFRQGKINKSEDAYRQAIAITPQKPWGYIAIASFYESQNRYDDAIRVYNKAITMLPDKVELRYNLAMNYYKNNEYSEAVDNLLQVIAKAPGFTLAYYNLGTLYFKMNENQDAIKYLKKAVSLNPVLTDAQFNLALALIKNGNRAEAKSALFQCNDVDPDDKQCAILKNSI